MTTIGDVINQVETVFYDNEFPPTKKELEVMIKILKTIYSHHRMNRAHHDLHAATGPQKAGVFNTVFPNYIRPVENRRQPPVANPGHHSISC
jgi:hypothetical protein